MWRTGELPPSLNQMNTLRGIHLESNAFRGPIPDLSNLTSLLKLNLGHSEFSGSIPESIRSLVSLQELKMHHNKLSGTLASHEGGITINYINVSCFVFNLFL